MFIFGTIRNLHIVTARSFSAFPLVFPAEKRIFVKTKQKRRTHEERGTDLRTLRKSVYRHRIQDYLRTTGQQRTAHHAAERTAGRGTPDRKPDPAGQGEPLRQHSGRRHHLRPVLPDYYGRVHHRGDAEPLPQQLSGPYAVLHVPRHRQTGGEHPRETKKGT